MRRLFGMGLGLDSRPSDEEVIQELIAAGTDLATPRPVDHFLSFPDERSARRAVAMLAGLPGDLRIGMTGGFTQRWVVQLTLPMTITTERVAALREQLQAVAIEHGGEYDGWGSAPG